MFEFEYTEVERVDRGKYLGYSNKNCNNCTRLRVEKWENGDLICEKCGMNQVTGEYEMDCIY